MPEEHDASTAPHRAAVLAGYRGDIASARALTLDPAPRVRAAAYGALARCDALDDATLRNALADDDPVVRRRAISLAVARPHIDVAGLLRDRDDTVVEHASWACGERAADAAIVAALSALAVEHDEPLVREAAVAALGAIGEPAGLAAILHACTDRATVRRRAVLALAPFDGPDVEQAIRTACTDRDWQVRQGAEDLASILGIDHDS